MKQNTTTTMAVKSDIMGFGEDADASWRIRSRELHSAYMLELSSFVGSWKQVYDLNININWSYTPNTILNWW